MQYGSMPFAMAGIGDAAEHIALMIAWVALLVAIGADLIAFTNRSWIPIIVSASAVLGVTILFTPWMAFRPMTAEDLQDLDAVHWIEAWRALAWAWGGTTFVSIAAASIVYFRHSRRIA